MEHSESDSISVPITCEDPELGFKPAISSPALKPFSNPDQSLDLDHVAGNYDSLPNELQNKLELKERVVELEKEGEEEVGNGVKVSNFNGGLGEEAQEEMEEGVNYGGDDSGWGENVEEGVNYGGDDSGWGENVYEASGWTEDVGCNDNERRVVEFGDNSVIVGEDLDNKYDIYNNGGLYQYPVRPEAEDCAFYMKTGTCKFGSNCKFNHPLRRKNQVYKGKARGNEELTERSSQTECKYHLSSGGCKFGKACRYNHTGMGSFPAPVLELNFLGLPIRLGEKECPYYMRNGSCKYGTSCKFNHPDPTAVGGGDSPSYNNGGCVPLQGLTQASIATWSTPVTLTKTPPFVPVMPLPNQGAGSPEWNGYQQPVYVPQRNMGPPAPHVMNSPEINAYGHLPQQMQVEEFPERPGEPDCSYFLKTGNCKFKFNCKFHHPKNGVARTPPCTLNDKGLPLRPDQNVCTHYSRYGICKFGPACKFDHPIHPSSPQSGLDRHSSYANSTTSEGPGIAIRGSGNAILQQSV